jgi:P4 family phage/plasmid primase-like protien
MDYTESILKDFTTPDSSVGYRYYIYSQSRYVTLFRLGKFIHRYCEYVKQDKIMSIAEPNPERCPLIIHGTFVIDDNTIKKLHKIVDEIAVVNDFTTIILTDNDIVERRMPYCRLDVKYQVNYIYKHFEGVDYNYINRPIPLYGSCDDKGRCMKLYGIYNRNNDDIYSTDISSAFNPTHHKLYKLGVISKDILDLYDNNSEFWLPLLLSLDYNVVDNVLKPNLIINKQYNMMPCRSQIDMVMDKSHLDTFIGMLKCIYNDIGRVMYWFYRGSREGLMEWIKLGGKEEDYVATPILTIKTLAWYAKRDSPDKFNQWSMEWYSEGIRRSVIEYSDINVCDTLFRCYWLMFVYSDGWWWYNGVRWIYDEGAEKLTLMIINDFTDKYKNYKATLDPKDEKVKKVDNILKKLSSHTYIKKLIGMAQAYMYDPNMKECRDSDPTLIGLENGVIEVRGNVLFRESKPEDYITKSTQNSWIELNWNSDVVVECMNWFKQLFPEYDLREYVLKVLASCLKYGNKEKAMYIMYGEKDCSKSTVKKLLEKTLGDYTHTFPTTLFTSKPSASSSPNPEMAHSKGSLISFIQEPNATDKIRDGLVKMLTGNDTFFARFLHDNGSKINPTFKLFLMCNKIPIIPSSDDAIKERLVIIPFQSKWVYNAPDNIEEQYRLRRFKLDPEFENKLPRLANAMLWIMVQYYDKYIKDGLTKPDIINKLIDQYWEENNIYYQFKKEYLVVDADNKVSVKDLYYEFKLWYEQNFPGFKIPNKTIFATELSSMLGKVVGGYWKGYKRVDISKLM